MLKVERIPDPDRKNSSYSGMVDPTIRSVTSLHIETFTCSVMKEGRKEGMENGEMHNLNKEGEKERERGG
jgi:hypothetical protein